MGKGLDPVRREAILAVSAAHDVHTAARVMGTTTRRVNAIRLEAGLPVRSPGRPTAGELERRHQREGCPCPWCAPNGLALIELRRRVRSMAQAGYATDTIAAVLGVPVEIVRVARRKAGRTSARWVVPT